MLHMHANLFNWPLLMVSRGHAKNTILKDFHVYLLLYQSLYDLTNPIDLNLISVLALNIALATT